MMIRFMSGDSALESHYRIYLIAQAAPMHVRSWPVITLARHVNNRYSECAERQVPIIRPSLIVPAVSTAVRYIVTMAIFMTET